MLGQEMSVVAAPDDHHRGMRPDPLGHDTDVLQAGVAVVLRREHDDRRGFGDVHKMVPQPDLPGTFGEEGGRPEQKAGVGHLTEWGDELGVATVPDGGFEIVVGRSEQVALDATRAGLRCKERGGSQRAA